jgi:predicted component of type VI protein secretion system
MRTFVIGRSPDADIVLADDSVARQHAELVITDDGRFHLTDCGDGDGTWRAVATRAGQEVWERTRQSFVAAGQPLRFGSLRVTVQELLARREPSPRDQEAAGPAGSGGGAGSAEPGLRGPVERDPLTGEIVRRGFRK